MHKIILLTGILISIPPLAWAETQSTPENPRDQVAARPSSTPTTKFVSDELTIMLRSGPGNNFKILRGLTSGTKLDAFETEKKFAHVRTRSGLEGWVLDQYLTDKPIAKMRLAAAQKKISQQEAKIKQLREQLNQLKASYGKIKDENRVLDKARTDLDAELNQVRSIAAKPLKLSEEKEHLAQQTETLETQVKSLKSELINLRDNTQKQWFLTGAAVILLGILIGLSLPKLRRQRRTDWR